MMLCSHWQGMIPSVVFIEYSHSVGTLEVTRISRNSSFGKGFVAACYVLDSLVNSENTESK